MGGALIYGILTAIWLTLAVRRALRGDVGPALFNLGFVMDMGFVMAYGFATYVFVLRWLRARKRGRLLP
jgi:hypothetical protein